MGMVLVLATISDLNRKRILADPPLVWQLLAPDDPDAYNQARARQARVGWLDRLLGRKAVPAQVPPLELEMREREQVELDKAWHGLHFLFTGEADEHALPAGLLVSGGQEVEGEEVGYGPARILEPDAVREVARFLDTVTDEQLKARYDPERMRQLDIYPDIWGSSHDQAESLGYLLEHAKTLRGIVGHAVSNQLGLLLALM